MTAYSNFESNAFDSVRNSFVQQLLMVLEQRYHEEELTIPQIAGQLNMSVCTLYRKIQAYRKTTPQLFLRDFRLSKAYLMLKNPEARISEVAYECGFKSIANFSRVFKTRYNICPLKIRKSASENPKRPKKPK